MEQYPDEEDTEDVNLDNDRKRHWRTVFEDNDGGVDDKKAFIHAKMCDIYVNKNEKIIKGGYLVEVVSSYRKKVIWGVVDDHVVEEEKYRAKIGIRGFDFNFFDEDEERTVGEGLSEYPYLLMLMKLRYGYRKNIL